MLKISDPIIDKRWDDLPIDLREALTSPVNSDFLWKICRTEHLPDEKIHLAARAVSFVLFGFIHPGDLAHELQDDLQINKQIAETIAKEVDDRIFEPLKEELDKAYEPPSKLEPPAPLIFAPSGISDIENTPPVMKDLRPTAVPQAPVKSAPVSPPLPPAGKPLQTNTAVPFSAPAKEIKIELSPVKPPPFSSPTPQQAPAPLKMGEFSRPTAAPAAGAQQMNMPPSAPKDSEPAPVSLHEETVIKPLRSSSGYGFSVPLPQSLEAKKEAAPMKPAVLELGNTAPAKSPAAPAQPAVRVVHYSESNAVANKPGQNAPQNTGREIHELTAMPPTPPPATKTNAPMPTSSVNPVWPLPVDMPRPAETGKPLTPPAFGSPSAMPKPFTPPAPPPPPSIAPRVNDVSLPPKP